jgi:hypothetical protein
MSSIHIKPRSSIADPSLARAAVVDLPMSRVPHRPAVPRALLEAVAALRRGPRRPERVVVMSLVPIPVRPIR